MVRGFRIFLPLLLTRVISPFSMDSFTSSSVRKAKKAILLSNKKIFWKYEWAMLIIPFQVECKKNTFVYFGLLRSTYGASRGQTGNGKKIRFQCLCSLPEFGSLLELQPTRPFQANSKTEYVETFAPNVEFVARSTWNEVSASSCLACFSV